MSINKIPVLQGGSKFKVFKPKNNGFDPGGELGKWKIGEIVRVSDPELIIALSKQPGYKKPFHGYDLKSLREE